MTRLAFMLSKFRH